MKADIHQGPIIDTHAMVEGYIKVGFTKQQAEMMTNRTVEFVNNNLATKTDIEMLHIAHKTNIEELRVTNKQDILALEHKIETLRSETQKDIALIRKDIALIHKDIEQMRKESKSERETLRKESKSEREALRKDITIKMGGMAIVIITVLGVLMQF